MSPRLRLRLAQAVASLLPPVGAHLLTRRIYPWRLAVRHAAEIDRRSITGSMLSVRTSDDPGYHFAVRGYYEWRALAVASAVCRAGDAVVEVGANIGTETAGLADIVGRAGQVIAFEPVPDNLELLRRNAAYGHVSVVPMAVARTAGSIGFTLPTRHNSGDGHISRSGAGDMRVQVTTLDEYFAAAAIPARLLMIDVEGAEVDVLAGGERWIARHRPFIIAEAHHNKTLLLKLLQDHGYAVYSLARWNLQPADPLAEQWNWLAVHAAHAAWIADIRRMLWWWALAPPLLRRRRDR